MEDVPRLIDPATIVEVLRRDPEGGPAALGVRCW